MPFFAASASVFPGCEARRNTSIGTFWLAVTASGYDVCSCLDDGSSISSDGEDIKGLKIIEAVVNNMDDTAGIETNCLRNNFNKMGAAGCTHNYLTGRRFSSLATALNHTEYYCVFRYRCRP